MLPEGRTTSYDYSPAGPAELALLAEPLFDFVGRRGYGDRIDLERVQNVLIVRLDEIGDTVLASPLFRHVRKAMPKAWITLVTKPAVSNLFARCPDIDELLTFNTGSPGLLRAPRLMQRALTFARAHLWYRHYDLAILPRFDADFSAATLVAYFSGAPWRIGFSEHATEDKQRLNRGYDRLLTHVVDADDTKHEVERSAQLARQLGIDTDGNQLELWFDRADQDVADMILASCPEKRKGPVVAIGPGARHPQRQWPVERFVELGRWLISQHDAQLVITGGPKDSDVAHALHVGLDDAHTINAAGRTTLRQTAALLSRCDAYIGNDSGPMHIAAAVQTDVIELSCHPTDGAHDHARSPKRFGPWAVASRVLQPQAAAAPCQQECLADEAHCILGIDVGQVCQAFDALAAQRDSAATPHDCAPTQIEYPTISVVVPNYNGGATLADTLQCLVDQGYPGLEIFVVDGGSTDDSVQIIKRYAPHIAWWISEPDRGQAHAINKGFAHATGRIVNWLCSDDLLLPGALRTVGEQFATSPATDVLVGRTRVEYAGEEHRNYVDDPTQAKIRLIPANHAFSQQSCFWRRDLLAERTGPLDESYEYAMDLELWAWFVSCNVRWKVIDDELGVFRNSGLNKTCTGNLAATCEFERVYRTYCPDTIPLTAWHRRLRFPLERLRRRHPGRTCSVLVRPVQIALAAALGPFYGLNRVRAMNWGAWT